jgi:hypothetical protein
LIALSTPVPKVAIEDFEQKIRRLEAAITGLQLTLLQMELQSSVATAVMAGPMQIVNTFLRSWSPLAAPGGPGPHREGAPPTPASDRARLASCIARLLAACERSPRLPSITPLSLASTFASGRRGLRLNKRHLKADQEAYQVACVV